MIIIDKNERAISFYKGGHHILISNNIIHNVPASIVHEDSNLCIFTKNEIYNCCFYQSSASSSWFWQ